MYQFYLGVDLHLKRSYVVLMKDDEKSSPARSLHPYAKGSCGVGESS
jgi:hypothetical protein